MKKGEQTREKLLDVAQGLILERGFSGVSIADLIEQMGMTKGAFFHHFKNKGELAHALIRRYADQGINLMQENLKRARTLSDDPLQQLLILVGLYIEVFDALESPYPGCLLASYIYELQNFDDQTIAIVNEEFEYSRQQISKLLEEAIAVHQPRDEIPVSALADAFMVCFEGAFILSKSLNDASITAQQLRLYRKTIELMFRP